MRRKGAAPRELQEIDRDLGVLTVEGWTTDLLILRLDRKVAKLMAQIDDLMAAVAADQAATDSAVALINSVQDQIVALTQQITDLQGQVSPDLQPAIDQLNAMAASLTSAEAPPEAPVTP